MSSPTGPAPRASAPQKDARGNILFMVLIGIFLFGLLTLAISDYSKDQSDVVSRQTEDDQINRMITHVATLGQAIGEMAISGAAQPDTLYSTLDLSKPGDATFESGNHALEIYYPTGGGVAYQSASSNSGTPVASGYAIDRGAIIVGVGPTDSGTGDIVFTANVQNATYCARINQIVNGSSAVPTMNAATFTSLFTNGTTVTVDATACASCVNIKQMCVTNGSGAYGFYSALYPQ
ncbi:MAG: hypothetical protein KGL10_05930 [Alphaproteobacteria bacterium]|nr:hypothetical protein [Alphaproteobacteria bacterium]MDE2336833.1 hypothetical protein [Alphaproteobacteria bacterium]